MNLAIIENNIVVNTIVAESKEIAEQITGLTCVEFTLENPAVIGLGWDGTLFEQPPKMTDEEIMASKEVE
jgi:hypothetical protein